MTRRARCCRGSSQAQLLGWAKVVASLVTSLGTAWDTCPPWSQQEGISQPHCAAECAEGGRAAGKCPSAVSWPGRPLGPGPRGSTGLGGGIHHGPLPALPAAPGELTVTEPVLSQRSAITHSRKPRQLLSVPRRAGPRARESIVREGLLVPCRPPCRQVPGSP